MNRLLRTAIPLTLLVATFLNFIACSEGPANTNQNSVNKGSPATNSEGNTAVALAAPKCNQTNPADRAQALNDHLRDNGLGDRDLERQRGNGKAFTVDFVVDGNEVVMKVKGKLAGGSDDPGDDPDPKMKHLLDRLDKYMKRGCADRSSFEGYAAGTSFGYEACPYPSMPCDDGTCNCRKDENGNIVPVNPATNGNSNSGSNSSGNTGSNQGSNTNGSNSSGPSPRPSND
jgi:hypothetical protein